MDTWEFIAKAYGGGQRIENHQKEPSGVGGVSGQADLAGFSLQAGQGGELSPGDSWRTRTGVDIQAEQTRRMGDANQTD